MCEEMRRREFLIQSGRAALGYSLLPTAGCVGEKAQPSTVRSGATAIFGALIADLENQIPKWMQESRIPGVSIVIINDAKLAWRRAFGVRDSTSKKPVDNDTAFEAASMSKPVFAYVVMKLCEKGVMNLDTPLSRYTPERFLEGDPRLDLITPRHVLSHTSGFQNWRSTETPLQIHFAPGEKYLYSGEGYNYLQTVVTHLMGVPFETYMRAKLFVPFRMNSTGYLWNDTFASRMARSHDVNGEPNGEPYDKKKPDAAGVARYGSAGALLTTPTDYARFFVEVIDPKPADAFRLNSDSIKEMLRPHVKLEGGQYPASWALGWQIFHDKKRDFIYHGGDNKGFHCVAVASAEEKSGFVAMTNGDNGPEMLKNMLSADSMQQFLTA